MLRACKKRLCCFGSCCVCFLVSSMGLWCGSWACLGSRKQLSRLSLACTTTRLAAWHMQVSRRAVGPGGLCDVLTLLLLKISEAKQPGCFAYCFDYCLYVCWCSDSGVAWGAVRSLQAA